MAEKNSQVSLVQYLETGSLSISWYVTLMLVEYCLPCQAVKLSELTVWCGGPMSGGWPLSLLSDSLSFPCNLLLCLNVPQEIDSFPFLSRTGIAQNFFFFQVNNLKVLVKEKSLWSHFEAVQWEGREVKKRRKEEKEGRDYHIVSKHHGKLFPSVAYSYLYLPCEVLVSFVNG